MRSKVNAIVAAKKSTNSKAGLKPLRLGRLRVGRGRNPVFYKLDPKYRKITHAGQILNINGRLVVVTYIDRNGATGLRYEPRSRGMLEARFPGICERLDRMAARRAKG